MKILIKLFFLYFTLISICIADDGDYDRYKKPHLIQESINEYKLVEDYVYIKFQDYYIKFTKNSESFNDLQLTLLVDVFKPKNKLISSSKKLFYPKPDVNLLNNYIGLSEKMKYTIKRSYVLSEDNSLSKISYDTYEFKESSTWIKICKYFHILMTKENKKLGPNQIFAVGHQPLFNIFNFVSKKPIRFHTSSALTKVRERAVWVGHSISIVKKENKEILERINYYESKNLKMPYDRQVPTLRSR